jgi:hypothetical protein
VESWLHSSEEWSSPSIGRQALWFFVHAALALLSWIGLMWLGYLMNPISAPQTLILLLSAGFPLLVGSIVARYRQDEVAQLVWLVGAIWLLIMGLWVLDLPTGPNQCFQCAAPEKLVRTFFSMPRPSGLMDNNGPFVGTWPAAALFGYAIGARLTLRGRSDEPAE